MIAGTGINHMLQVGNLLATRYPDRTVELKVARDSDEKALLEVPVNRNQINYIQLKSLIQAS